MPGYFLSDDSDPERSASIARRIEEAVPGLVKIAKIGDIGGGGNAAPSDLSCPTHRDFVPWRFSDAGCQSAWLASWCRRPKTCTQPASRAAKKIERRSLQGQISQPR
jgi:hypothetical protein